MSDRPASVGEEVLFEVVDHIALVTLNRPDKRNAVNGPLTEALDWVVKAVEDDDDVRVAILASSLETTFCAGADLAEIVKGNGAALRSEGGGFAGFVDAKRAKPWIAAVRGSALAGGCELTLACDMIVASQDATFGLPEVKRGLYAGAGGIYRLPRALPRNVALELIATGNPMNVQRAYELGLVNRIAPLATVIETAKELAGEIAVNAPLSVRESLRVARLAAETPDAQTRELSREAAMVVMTSEDAKEGPRAFLEKRAPRWTGR
ncbi:MAG: enoyl-CoA hydratase-related protein [Caulobacteraceae bacterium]